MNSNFTGKRVLVTGGTRGLGRVIVQKFNDAGATVYAIGKDPRALLQLNTELPAVKTIQVDLSNWEATKEAVEKAGPFNHLINNAAILTLGPILEVAEDDVDCMFAINFKAAVNVAQCFTRGFVDAGTQEGAIVNVSSVIDRKGSKQASIYASTKAALSMLTKSMAAELGQFGIRVNSIRPCHMTTSLYNSFMPEEVVEEFVEKLNSVSPIPGAIDKQQVAELIMYLCSPSARMITGEDVAVDGGYSIL